MAQIKIDWPAPPVDGAEIKFKAPCDCTQVEGLLLCYVDAAGVETSKSFTFRDAHGNDLTGIGNLFTAGAYIKAMLDVGHGYAYLQNAATNGYLESKQGAINLLDNSNFEQFIAQAGIGGAHGTQNYAGDRWILESGAVTGTANENDNGYSAITLNGTIIQIVANPPAVGTPALEMVSGTAFVTYDADAGEIAITSEGGVIKNVGLYEGEYAAGSEPKYQPKGYAAEWAECRNYFKHIPFYTSTVGCFLYARYLRSYFPYEPMRVKNPTLEIKQFEYHIDDSWEKTTPLVELSGNVIMLTVPQTNSAKAIGHAAPVRFEAILNADL